MNKNTINKEIREYLFISMGFTDPRKDPLVKRAKKIVRERNGLIKELCEFLAISTNTDLTYNDITLIDEKIKKIGSREVYSKYHIHLGVFLGEIIIKKTNGKWFIKKHEDPNLFITYEVPMLKTGNEIEYCPWSRLGRYYDDNTGEFSLYLGFSGITDSFEVYKQDYRLN